MALPVLEKRASDLFDKYVGETEKKIAGAFEEALEAGVKRVFGFPACQNPLTCLK